MEIKCQDDECILEYRSRGFGKRDVSVGSKSFPVSDLEIIFELTPPHDLV